MKLYLEGELTSPTGILCVVRSEWGDSIEVVVRLDVDVEG